MHVLSINRAVLDGITAQLLTRETLSGSELNTMLARVHHVADGGGATEAEVRA